MILIANSSRYYLLLSIFLKAVCNNNNIFSVYTFIKIINRCCFIGALLVCYLTLAVLDNMRWERGKNESLVKGGIFSSFIWPNQIMVGGVNVNSLCQKGVPCALGVLNQKISV